MKNEIKILYKKNPKLAMQVAKALGYRIKAGKLTSIVLEGQEDVLTQLEKGGLKLNGKQSIYIYYDPRYDTEVAYASPKPIDPKDVEAMREE